VISSANRSIQHDGQDTENSYASTETGQTIDKTAVWRQCALQTWLNSIQSRADNDTVKRSNLNS